MSAPERIYMDADIEVGDGYWTRCFETPKPCSEPALEYVRADITADRIATLRAKGEQGVDVLESVFMDAVWGALKSDATDLVKQQRILEAFRITRG